MVHPYPTHRRGPGRPCIMQSIATLVVRMAVGILPGIHTHSRRTGQSGARGWTRYDRTASQGQRDRAGPSAWPARNVVYLPEGSLGMHSGNRFLHRRGPYTQGPDDVLRVALYRHQQPRRKHRRQHCSSRQPMDDANRTQCDRPERGFPARQVIPDSRSGYKILRGFPEHPFARGYRSDSPSTTDTEFERVRRTLRALNQVGVFEQNDLLRTGITPARDWPLHGALSH
jgi:hypothetical protein